MSGVSTERVTADEAGLRLDRWFKRRYPDLPHGRLQKLARSGQIRIDGKRAKPADRVEAGQAIRVPPLGAPPSRPRQAEKPAPTISGTTIQSASAPSNSTARSKAGASKKRPWRCADRPGPVIEGIGHALVPQTARGRH